MADTATYTEDPTSSPLHQTHPIEKHDPHPRDRDSGVFMSDNEDVPATPATPSPLSREPSTAFYTPTTTTTTSPLMRSDSTTTRRLRRPAELNLSSTSSTPTPKSELEQRFDMIRNSSTQNRAALKSPTQLLRDRLGLSPKKKLEEKVRVFTAPAPMIGGCVLPGPSAAPGAMGTGIVGRDVRARTQAGGRAAWWCKFDRLVVFDGVDAEGKVCTRSSKGLSIARRRGDAETVVIALECGHCRDMLRREEWKYDVRVCKRGVCWDCRERCAWEAEQERVRNGASEDGRERADSVVQDAALGQEVDLCVKAGIEVVERGTIEVVGGIEERLDAVVEA